MDHIGSSESDLDFELESGGTQSSTEEDGSEELGSDGKHIKNILGRSRSGFLFVDGSITASDGLDASKNLLNIGENTDMAEGGMEKRMVEKQKKKSSKKHPKPPRPPTGPSLGAADIELVKEISKRTRLRRERRERMKKKMKSDKASSSKINIFAMVITTIFFLVIIFQGFLSAHV